MKNFDSIKFSKSKKIPTIYRNSSGKVKIISSRSSNLLKVIVYVLISILLVTLTVTNTLTYQIYSLLKDIKHQSILIGFQNSAELRPTGGFWGSFAILDARSNVIDSTISFDTNPYKIDNALLKSSTTELPSPMKQIWSDRPQTFINANWSVNFPDSAKTLQWYFGQGWGDKKIDGVVAVSSMSIIDLLNIIGEISLEDGTKLNSENFTQIMSEKIDSEYWKNKDNITINEPKTLIKELFPLILKKTQLLPKITLYKFLVKQMSQGRILAYFNDNNLQNLSEKINIAGSMKPYSCDYLMINNANISGHKTSLNIKQLISYDVDVTNNQYISNLSITRNHLNLWPYRTNTNYTRVFVPLGSKLISAKIGTDDITNDVLTEQDQGRTSFGFWFNTDSGQQKNASIIYHMPCINETGKYNIIFQKQPGTNADWLKFKINDKIFFDGEFDQISAKFPNILTGI